MLKAENFVSFRAKSRFNKLAAWPQSYSTRLTECLQAGMQPGSVGKNGSVDQSIDQRARVPIRSVRSQPASLNLRRRCAVQAVALTGGALRLGSLPVYRGSSGTSGGCEEILTLSSSFLLPLLLLPPLCSTGAGAVGEQPAGPRQPRSDQPLGPRYPLQRPLPNPPPPPTPPAQGLCPRLSRRGPGQARPL